MKTLIRVAAVLAFGAGAACAATGGGDRALVSPSQPHAVISTALPPTPSLFAARIIWIDGSYLSTQGRSSYWVKPGEHEIGFSAIITANRGPAMIMSPATSQPIKMQTVKIDLKQGYTYYFAAAVPDGNPSRWHPVLLKKEKRGG